MAVLKNLLIALDQAVNTLIRLDGEWGTPDESLSARAWRVRDTHPKLHRWIDRAFFWEEAHSRQSYESELYRRHLPREYEWE